MGSSGPVVARCCAPMLSTGIRSRRRSVGDPAYRAVMGTNWINTVSRDHVERGVRGRFTQANHGKPHMLKKMAKGDWIVFYSPKTVYPDGEPLQAFTAIGQVADDEPYQAEMSPDFQSVASQCRFPGLRRDSDPAADRRSRLHRGQVAVGLQVPLRRVQDRRPRPGSDPFGDDETPVELTRTHTLDRPMRASAFRSNVS